MGIEQITAGANAPLELNAIIETTPATGSVKYEFDKDTGMIVVDRFMGTTMQYPCLYGFVPNTLVEDGDPLDVLVLSPDDVMPGCMMTVRPIGVLIMEDESGLDSKVLTVPTKKACPSMAHMNSLADVPVHTRNQIQHFFERYKDLESHKWVKVTGWECVEKAHSIIKDSIKRVG